MNRKLLFPVVVLVVSSIACSTFTRSTPENTVNVESTPTIETTIPQTEVVEAPTAVPTIDLSSITSAEDLPPLTFDEVLDARIESGEWTEGEGLLKLINYFIDSNSLGVDNITIPLENHDGSDIIYRAQQYIKNSDNNDDLSMEIKRLLGNIFPNEEILEKISEPEKSDDTAKLFSPMQANRNQVDFCEDYIEGGYEHYLKEEIKCLLSIELDPVLDYYLYYPRHWKGDEEKDALIEDTVEASMKAIDTYKIVGAYVPEKLNIIFHNYEVSGITGVYNNNDDDSLFPCTNILFPSSNKVVTGLQYKQMVAQFVYYCFQDLNISKDSDNWWYYATAEYFSNLVYPTANFEHRLNKYFDIRSTKYSILNMKKENFVLIQYLGNQKEPIEIIYLLREIENGKHLSEFVDDPMFNAFVVDYLSTGIPDTDGETRIKAITPIEQLSSQFKATISEESNFFLSSPPFTATRYLVDYEKEKRFLQSEEGSVSAVPGIYSAVEADLYQNKAAWSAPPEEIRSFCEKNKKYLYVSTTTSGNQFNPAFKITKVEKASCDPCLLGVWKVDNDSFSNYMMDIFVKNGVDFTQSLPNVGEIYMYTTGDYFLGFKEGGEMGTWRNEFTISVGVPSVTTFDTVIQSAGLGNYSADGKILTINDLTDKVISSKFYMGDSELPDSGSTDASDFYLFRPSYSADVSDKDPTQSSGNREYKCNKELLVLSHESEPDLVFTRADELIPTPIPTESNP